MGHHLQLEGVVRPLPAEAGQGDGQQTRRVEDGRLRVRQEGQAAVVVRVPQRDLTGPQPRRLVRAEGHKLAGEVAFHQRDLIGLHRRQEAPEEPAPQRQQDQAGQGVRPPFRARQPHGALPSAASTATRAR